MTEPASILRVDPPRGIPGGEVNVDCSNLDTSNPTECAVWFNEVQAPIVALGPNRILAVIPELKRAGEVTVRLKSGTRISEPHPFECAHKLAEDLHPVSNPAVDPDDGSIFVTRSGPRGEQLPVTLFKIDTDGILFEFSGDITNPTGIAFDQSGEMFVTSRLDGTVYRVTPFKESTPFATNLGIATGIAFNSTGVMFIGDRSGTIFKISGVGEEQSWAQLEPSVSAYHLAFGRDDWLYVTGPALTSFDSVYRIDSDRNVNVFYKGLGRPQGLAFDVDGNLYLAASLSGRRGIVRIDPAGTRAEIFAAGMNLVGVAFTANGDLVIASNDSVYRLSVGIQGLLPH